MQLQLFATAAQPLLPGCGQGLQALDGSEAAPVQSGADHGHLQIEGVEQGLQRAAAQAAAQQLAALAQQTAIAAQQVAIDGLQLQHHPVQPLAATGRFASHQLQVEGTEAHTAQGAQQV